MLIAGRACGYSLQGVGADIRQQRPSLSAASRASMDSADQYSARSARMRMSEPSNLAISATTSRYLRCRAGSSSNFVDAVFVVERHLSAQGARPLASWLVSPRLSSQLPEAAI